MRFNEEVSAFRVSDARKQKFERPPPSDISTLGICVPLQLLRHKSSSREIFMAAGLDIMLSK